MIEIINVTHHYGIRPVLRDITMHIERGELVALMGPNGIGKTTLMQLLAGILWPARESIEIDGLRRRVSDDAELSIRKTVVYVAAEAWLPQYRTGRDWLLAVGRVYGQDELELMEHVDSLMALFELTDKQDSPIASYSTGQKKKLNLSAALISEAKVMLLDEPFGGGLDPSGIMALKGVLQRLREERKTTIVMATPVPELVEDLADRVAVLRDGRLAALETIDGLRRQTGCGGRLDEVYAAFISPQTNANVDNYFKRGRA